MAQRRSKTSSQKQNPNLRLVGKSNLDRVPPHDETSEMAALGAMIVDERAANIAFDMLEIENFYLPRNQKIFKFFKYFKRRGLDLDPVVLLAEAKRMNQLENLGGRNFISNLLASCGSAGNVEAYCKVVIHAAKQRSLIENAYHAIASAHGKLDNEATSKLLKSLEELDRQADVELPPTVQIYNDLESEISGKRFSVNTPWFWLSRTRSLSPGTVTILCGSPGVSKSLFTVELLHKLQLRPQKPMDVSGLFLEDGSAYHTRRGLAQISGEVGITNDSWVRKNPEKARAVFQHHKAALKRLEDGRCIQSPPSHQPANAGYILNWIETECRRGKRVISVDPITLMDGSDKRHIDQEKLIFSSKRIIERYGASLFLVMHPRDAPPGKKITPALRNLPGSRSIERAAHTVFWLEYKPLTKESLETPCGKSEEEYNRALHVLKSRNSGSTSWIIAYYMDRKNLCHFERGRIE